MNHVEATLPQLIQEALIVKSNMEAIEYTGERLQQQRTRLGMVALEILSRDEENYGEDPQTMFAFSDIAYFGLHKAAPGLRLGTASVDVGR